jgi:tetratricopeptide (TPR) repeat protein
MRKVAAGALLAALVCGTTAAFAGQMAASEAASYFKEGVEAQKKEKFTNVIMSYQKTMLVAPSNQTFEKSIANNLGIMYAQQGDIDRAELLFKEALKIDPNYQAAQYNLGLILDRRPDKLKALEYWLKVLKIDLNALKPKNFQLEQEGEAKP